MTDEEMDKIDADCAVHVMGCSVVNDWHGSEGKWLVHPDGRLAGWWREDGSFTYHAWTKGMNYTRSWSDAGEVVERMKKSDWYFTLTTYQNGYGCVFSMENYIPESCMATTAPLAITLAALAAVGHPRSAT